MTQRPLSLAAAFALGAALFATLAAAQTMYKLIDRNGKVTYSESPPKDFNGKVIRMDIDPKANTATLPKYTPPPPAKADAPRASSGGGPTDKVQLARDKLEAAKKALQDATDNPRETDIQRIGIKGGGTRPVPTEDYQKRLENLAENVKRAEEELRVAEGR